MQYYDSFAEFIKNFTPKINNNFYNVNKEQLLHFKPLEKRLSKDFCDFDLISDEEEFYDKSIRYLVRFSHSLFNYVSNENEYNISFNPDSYNSFCSLETNYIEIGIKSLDFNSTISKNILVDSLISTIIHEKYHKRITIRDLKTFFNIKGNYYEEVNIDELRNLLKNKTFTSIINILEDKRIEQLGANEFPGYIFFFEESRKLAFYNHSKPKIESELGNYILLFLLIKVLLPELLDTFYNNFGIAKNNYIDFLNSKKIPKRILDKYIHDIEFIIEPTFDKINKLIDENTEKIISNNITDILNLSEQIYDLFPENIKNQTEIEYGGKHSLCEMDSEQKQPNPNKDKITEIIHDEFSSLNNDAKELEEEKCGVEVVGIKDENSSFSSYRIVDRPLSQIDFEILSKAKKISKIIISQLSFLDARFFDEESEYELEEGEIDEDELYSLNYNSKNIFKESYDIPDKSMNIGILIDESGSMIGSNKIQNAKIAAIGLALGLTNNKRINLAIYGHNSSSDVVSIYKYYNSFEGLTDIDRMFSVKANSGNADGYAIEWVGVEMLKKHASDNILIVISDGQPVAKGYGGVKAMAHVRNVVNSLKTKKVSVIQICIDNIANSDKMFDEFIPYDEEGSFIEKLTRLISSKISQFINSI